ncbi:MAG: hypothetical protein KDF49_07945, partial [Nitrosomonas sp.]|nr:hypothetical protein [Nitrosomonas sp.]
MSELFLLSLKWCQARHEKRGLVIPNKRRITRHGTISGTTHWAGPAETVHSLKTAPVLVQEILKKFVMLLLCCFLAACKTGQSTDPADLARAIVLKN